MNYRYRQPGETDSATFSLVSYFMDITNDAMPEVEGREKVDGTF
jgi:hypothetical protein